MWEAVAADPRRFRAATSVRVVVLTGAGGKAFVSGADISEFENERAPQGSGRSATTQRSKARSTAHPRIRQADHRHDPRLLHRRRRSALAISCDMRICSEVALRASRPPSSGSATASSASSSWSIWSARPSPRTSSSPRASSTAAEALRMGLVNRVVPSARARELRARTTPTPSRQRAAHRQCGQAIIISEALKDESPADLDRDVPRLVRDCFDSDDYAEGRTAFMEKRKPVFTGT